jgi:hypothetical protein
MGKKIAALAGLIAIGSIFATPALSHHRSRGYYESYRPYPVACEAVIAGANIQEVCDVG